MTTIAEPPVRRRLAVAEPSTHAPPGPAIRVRSLVKSFRSYRVLDRVDLDVAPGEIVALLGANGAGKSTLLRILGTTILPDSGSVHVGGADVTKDAAAARRAIGLVLGDERSWYWRLSGRQNLEFFAALHGLRRRPARARADALLARCGLTDAADRRVTEYSSGMRLRLALARAQLVEPDVLLLDEPTGTLDPVAAKGFRDQLRAVVAARRTAVLFATHDLHEAVDLATTVFILRGGQLRRLRPEERATAGEVERLLVEGGA